MPSAEANPKEAEPFYPPYLIRTTMQEAIHYMTRSQGEKMQYRFGSTTVLSPTDNELLESGRDNLRRIITITAWHPVKQYVQVSGTRAPWPKSKAGVGRNLVIVTELDPNDNNWKPFIGYMEIITQRLGNEYVSEDFKELWQTMNPNPIAETILRIPVRTSSSLKAPDTSLLWTLDVADYFQHNKD
ncbi:MAG: hypothetical protein M1829_002311 [Trizodia sp. TS-e1964]|nr:MAG: hypothetical protein M1829_002311 [Trizodia sp. TS-e1964]